MEREKVINNTSNDMLPIALPGFEHINRYWDRIHETYAAKILPGQYYVTKNKEVIVTVLGSCIAACIRDPVACIGGMNHFMLPHSSDFDSQQINISNGARYGSYAMEMLINDILKLGGIRDRLEVKLFGGGRIIKNMSNIGMKNIEFAQEYIQTEKLKLIAADIGDDIPRKVYYFPDSGKARVKKLFTLHNATIQEREQTYMRNLEADNISGEVDLFD